MSLAIEKSIVRPVEVVGPYSSAVRIGNFLFVSGQIGIDQETGALRNENIEVETRQVLDKLISILRSAGYDSSHVVSTTVYLKNMSDYAMMNLIYGGYFQEDTYPSRVTVGVSDLPRGANVEISLVAYR
jgi:2-iminobutanoate/2-iminopropanoate deaminase